MSNKQNILILSVSAGAGHVRAAQALEAWASKSPNCTAVHVDMMSLVPALFKKIYADSYIKMVEQMPEVWGYLYNKTDQARADSLAAKMRRAVERLNTSKLDALLEETEADQIICTHFLPAELLSRKIRKGKFDKAVWIVVTDFDIHRFWLHQHISGYFAASDEVAFRMVHRGIDAKIIHVTGIPVMPQFAQKHSREDCCKELGISPAKPTLLLMSGGVGLGGIEDLAGELLSHNRRIQIIALAGRNKDLLRELKKVARKHQGRLTPLPFTSTVERVMACADLAVSKPGGLTTSECLATGLPMLVVSPIPGQEERNADFLLENGAALKAVDAAGVLYRVDQLLSDPRGLSKLRKNAKRLGTPRAASHILKKVLSDGG